MLMAALRIMVNNSFQENFDNTFMGNEKNYQNSNYFFFLIKTLFKWIVNHYLKGIYQYFPNLNQRGWFQKTEPIYVKYNTLNNVSLKS